MFRNNYDEPNVVVAVGDARYVMDRRIAKTIKVKIVCEKVHYAWTVFISSSPEADIP